MSWLTLKQFAGFSSDLTNWTIEIDSGSSFHQKVELCRPIRRSHQSDNRVLVYTGRLTKTQMSTLRTLVDAIDFADLIKFEGYPHILDVGSKTIKVECRNGGMSFKGPIFWYLSQQKPVENLTDPWLGPRLPDHLTLQELTDLWTFVHDLVPFPPDEERKRPRQSRALPLPETRLEIKAREIPEHPRTPPRPRVPVTFGEIKLRLEAALVNAWEHLAKSVTHDCPTRAKCQILEFYWPEDDGSPECEREHLRVLSEEGLSVDEAVTSLLYDGRMASVYLVPTRVDDGFTFFKLLAQTNRVESVFARSDAAEAHPFSLYTGPITPMDPEVCIGGEKFALQEQRFWDYYADRCP